MSLCQCSQRSDTSSRLNQYADNPCKDLEWTEETKNVPFFRMVTPEGPSKDKALTFASLRHNNMSLARRDRYKDPLRVHGIRGGVANKVDGLFFTALLRFLIDVPRAGV